MAVITTVQDILNGAYGRSTKNQPGTIAAESSELLEVVNRIHRGIYAFGARLNPNFFAETASVAEVAGTWLRPDTAESIIRVEDSGNVEVTIVPIDDRAAEPTLLAVYEFGQKFFVAAGLVPAGNLTFFYSKRPTTYTLLTDLLDSLWTEQFNEILVLELAMYLSSKDGRFDEVQVFAPERDRWVALLGAFLQHSTSNLRRRFGHRNTINVQTLIPLFFSQPGQ